MAPSGTRIEKVVTGTHYICFYLPKKVLGFLNRRIYLELTPTEVKLKDKYGMGCSWKIPIAALQASHITWYFEEKKPVLGINYKKKTYTISSLLTQKEVEWLYGEIKTFVLTINPEYAETSPQRFETKFEKIVEGDKHVRFYVPVGIQRPIIWFMTIMFFFQLFMFFLLESDSGIPDNFWHLLLFPVMLLALLIIAIVLRKYTQEVIDITPQWIRVYKQCFGKNIGERKYVPTAGIRPSDINWYMKDSGFGNSPVLGINSDGKTFEIAILKRFRNDEIKWLIYEIRASILKIRTAGEPSCEKPIVSPETAEAMLQEKTALAQVGEQESSFLEGSEIEKIVKGEGHIQFRIPGHFNETVLQQLAFPLIVLFWGLFLILFRSGGDETTDAESLIQTVLILTLFIGIGRLVMMLHHIFGYTILDLTPQWLRIRYELLGLGFSRSVPTAAITRVNTAQRYTNNNKLNVEWIEIFGGGKTLELGSHLPIEEKKWIIAELRQYLSTVETPEVISGFTAKINTTSQGIEISIPTEHFFRKEKVLVSKERMTIGYSFLGIGGKEHFEVANIHDLRLASQQHRRSGKLVFDYKTHPIVFCRHVSDVETRILLKHLSNIITFHCHSIERIIFGSHQIPGDDPSTILCNPDVSELTFPFVRLQQVNIHTETYDFYQVERFLTYAVNYIGQKKLKKQVEVHLYGDPQKLHPNLRNSFQNIFKYVYVHEEHQ